MLRPRSRNCTCWRVWCVAWAARASTTACATPTSATQAPPGQARWLGRAIASLSRLDAVLVVGSFLRKDHPLLAQRLRQAVRHGAQ
jgi:NADH dehydrogenase/NADH:ubiquinone oxidoreductase subunit G